MPAVVVAERERETLCVFWCFAFFQENSYDDDTASIDEGCASHAFRDVYDAEAGAGAAKA
jgi:hypothetical protein